jgi:Transposase and inactivated derivatives
MKTQRQKHSGAFKAKVAIEALQERESIHELASKYGIHSNMISRWKKEFLERAPELFDKPGQEKKDEADLEKLYAKIGQLEMERDFLKKILKKLGL